MAIETPSHVEMGSPEVNSVRKNGGVSRSSVRDEKPKLLAGNDLDDSGRDKWPSFACD